MLFLSHQFKATLFISLCLVFPAFSFLSPSIKIASRHRTASKITATGATTSVQLEMASNVRILGDPHVENVLFIECGFGNDSHGQNATKAAVRACRNAIEFNSIPSINRLVPGGYDNLKLDVLLAVPAKYKESLDLTKVADAFPYGSIRFQIQDGGMVAPSGIAIDRLGDTNEDMVVVCVAVTVGH